MEMTITEKLATFITEASLEKMPAEVLTLAKRGMIDTLGVALAGSVHSAGKAITAFVAKFGCRPTAGVIGDKIRTSSALAALANGTIAHILDYDDFRNGGHLSAVLMPVVLSLGEELRASGKEVIEAYVLGVEVWAKLFNVMPKLHLKGWHPTGVLGTVGAGAAAAKLLKLTAEQTTMAMGIACSKAAGLLQNFGTMTKSLHVGNAAKNGIMAALLAKEGFTAAKNVLEGDANFPLTFYGRDIGDVSKMIGNLGAPYSLIYPGINVKSYPACGSTHKALDAILHLIRLYHIKPEEVEDVRCQSNPVVQKVLFYNDPRTVMESKFSMQFAMAVALTDQRLGLAQSTDEKLNDPTVRKLMKRVTLSVHPDWVEGKDTIDNRADVVTVRLQNGREYTHEVLVPKGAPKNPFTEEELLNKYRECAKIVLKDEGIERCIELVWKLEKLEDVKEIIQIVAV